MTRARLRAVLFAPALLAAVWCRPRPVRREARTASAPESAAAGGLVRGHAPAGSVVFVSGPIDLDRAPAGSGTARPSIKLEIRGGALVPRIAAAPLGSELQILSAEDRFVDLAAYFGLSELAFRHKFVLAGDQFSFALERPGLLVFEDENQPLERGYLYVTPTGEFDVVGEAGTYSIAGIPAGKRRLTAWNEKFGVRDAEVVVEKDRSATLDFEFSPGI